MSLLRRRCPRQIGIFTAIVGGFLVLSCSRDSTGPARFPYPLSIASVSSPYVPASSGSASGAAATASMSVVYVSMRPGAQPTGESVSIVNSNRTDPPVIAPLVAGGFDPVALQAQIGDTLVLGAVDVHGAIAKSVAVVRADVAPNVVRTEPVSNVSDFAADSGVTVVFDEPMDTASLSSSVHLRLDTKVVDAASTFTIVGGGAVRMRLQPVEALDSGQSYQLEIRATARNLSGRGLADQLFIPFSVISGRSLAGLTVESFAMIEFHADGQYYYAPQ